jgi:hypothetical protein
MDTSAYTHMQSQPLRGAKQQPTFGFSRDFVDQSSGVSLIAYQL